MTCEKKSNDFFVYFVTLLSPILHQLTAEFVWYGLGRGQVPCLWKGREVGRGSRGRRAGKYRRSVGPSYG